MERSGWPLVGRAEELAFGLDALAGGANGLVISGAAGVGKTRLADELLRRIGDGGSIVVRLVATRAAATIPLGAATPLLGAGTDHADKHRDAASAVRATFAELRARGVVVVGVDDVHLLDPATAALLQQVVAEGDAKLLATVRGRDPGAEAVRGLWEGAGCTRLELQPLGHDDVHRLLTAVLDGQVEGRTIERLWQVSQGNAMLLRELSREALEAGTLSRQHGTWTWTAAPFAGARLQEIIDDRIGRLSVAEREAATLLALGEPLPRPVAENLMGSEVCAGLAARGLIVDEPSDGRHAVRLAHPLYAESLRARLGPLEATDLYARLVAAVGPPSGDLEPEDRLRVAVWSVSGGVPLGADGLAAAAHDARRRDDVGLAERLARAALGLPAGPGPVGALPVGAVATPPAFEAALTLGEVLADGHRPDEAESVLSMLAGVAPDDAARARVAAARIAAVQLGGSGLGAARRIAAGTQITDRQAQDVVDAALAKALSHAGQIEEAGTLALDLIGSAQEEVPPAVLGPAAAWLTHVGRSDEATAAAMRLLPAASGPTGSDGAGARFRSGWVTYSRSVSLLFAGRLDQLDDVLELALHDPHGQPYEPAATLPLLRGRAALLRGRPVTARANLREAVLALERTDSLGRIDWVLALLAEAEALLGDASEAAATLTHRRTRPESRRYERDAERALVWVVALAGDVTGAQRQGIERADDARRAGHVGFELWFLDAAVRLGASQLAARLTAVAEAVEGPGAAAIATFAAAAVAGDGGRLDKAAERLAATQLHLHAAEAYLRAAEAHRSVGLRARADASASRSRALQERCEGARTPGLTAVPGAGLTPREREVATLAANGLSSRAIADHLGVSIRTIDNQLGRTYGKLGIRGRRDLPTALGLRPAHRHPR